MSRTAAADESLADAFWAVARRLRGAQPRDAGAVGHHARRTSRALRVLLRRRPDAPERSCREHLHIAPRSATEVVDALSERGLVERRPDPDDRRATLVVTDRRRARRLGRAIRDGAGARRRALLRQRSAPPTRPHLARILRKLRD